MPDEPVPPDPFAYDRARMASTDPARRFRWALAGIVLAGFALRLTWILVTRQHQTFGGDAGFYHLGANLLVDGKGFVSPYHPSRQAADHPPLYMLWLAIPSLVGLRSQLAHMVWSAVLGCASIALVGATGRQIGGTRVGLIAAGIAALYPNMWVPDGSLMAETVAIFTTALALYWAYRYWHEPSWGKLAIVGRRRRCRRVEPVRARAHRAAHGGAARRAGPGSDARASVGAGSVRPLPRRCS